MRLKRELSCHAGGDKALYGLLTSSICAICDYSRVNPGLGAIMPLSIVRCLRNRRGGRGVDMFLDHMLILPNDRLIR